MNVIDTADKHCGVKLLGRIQLKINNHFLMAKMPKSKVTFSNDTCFDCTSSAVANEDVHGDLRQQTENQVMEHDGQNDEQEKPQPKDLADEKKYPPPDGGYGWAIVISAIFLQVFTVPLLPMFGILFGEQLSKFNITTTEIKIGLSPKPTRNVPKDVLEIKSAIVSVHLSFWNLSSLFMVPFLQICSARSIAVVGTLCSVFGVFLSAYVNNAVQMALTFGVLAGIGFGLTQTNSILLVSKYFRNKIGTALGVLYTGLGIGSLAMPQIVKLMFDLDAKMMIIIYSLICLLSLIATIPMRSFEEYAKRSSAKDPEEYSSSISIGKSYPIQKSSKIFVIYKSSFLQPSSINLETQSELEVAQQGPASVYKNGQGKNVASENLNSQSHKKKLHKQSNSSSIHDETQFDFEIAQQGSTSVHQNGQGENVSSEELNCQYHMKKLQNQSNSSSISHETQSDYSYQEVKQAPESDYQNDKKENVSSKELHGQTHKKKLSSSEKQDVNVQNPIPPTLNISKNGNFEHCPSSQRVVPNSGSQLGNLVSENKNTIRKELQIKFASILKSYHDDKNSEHGENLLKTRIKSCLVFKFLTSIKWKLLLQIRFLVLASGIGACFSVYFTFLSQIGDIASSKGMSKTDVADLLTYIGVVETLSRSAHGVLGDIATWKRVFCYPREILYVVMLAALSASYVGVAETEDVILFQVFTLLGAFFTAGLMVNSAPIMSDRFKDDLPSAFGIMSIFRDFLALFGYVISPIFGSFEEYYGDFRGAIYFLVGVTGFISLVLTLTYSVSKKPNVIK